ncbi:MAG: hypothetical protein MIO92_01230 [Methanosarcinaceae archaeon]|nr:hypothetical protein [Methanosarcinaceae archaeon]
MRSRLSRNGFALADKKATSKTVAPGSAGQVSMSRHFEPNIIQPRGLAIPSASLSTPRESASENVLRESLSAPAVRLTPFGAYSTKVA